MIHTFGRAEIAKFDFITILINQNVLRLDIPMNNALAVQVAKPAQQLPSEHLYGDHRDEHMWYRISTGVIQTSGTVYHVRQCLVIERRNDMQICVVRSIAIRVIVVTNAQNIRVISGTQKQVQLTILVPCVLINSLDRNCLISMQIGSSIY